MTKVRQRLHRWPTWFVLVGLALVVGAGLRAPLPYFVEMPGSAVTLGACVEVQAEETTPLHGDFLLTTVSLRRATPFSLLRVALDPAASLRPDDRVVSPGVGDDDHFAGQRQVFGRTAQQSAALGLQAAGYGADPEHFIGDGALVTGVLEGSPAHGVLRGGDVIIEVDGRPVGTETELREAIEGTEPLVLTIQREGEPYRAMVAPTDEMVTGAAPSGLGVRVQTVNSRIELPVPVDVVSGRIGGPSAGLMIGLAVYDQAESEVNLAAGRRIAGTGTLTSQGAVGRIGGVELKALAAHRRGADVFLVPATQIDQAHALLPRNIDMEVVPVASFDEARQLLLESVDTEVRAGDPDPTECPLRPPA